MNVIINNGHGDTMIEQQLKEEIAPILLVGNPNVGKSALFGALSGRYVEVSNYPGTTVDFSAGWMKIENSKRQIFDSPGADTLSPVSEDEVVTRDLLLKYPESPVICVMDSKNLQRGLVLLSQLAEFKRKTIVVLNMADEALESGIEIDIEKLRQIVNVPVISTIATQRHGIDQIKASLARASIPLIELKYPAKIEEVSDKIQQILSGIDCPAGVSISYLSGENGLPVMVANKLGDYDYRAVKRLKFELESSIAEPIGFIIAKIRNEKAKNIADQVLSIQESSGSKILSRLGELSIHPVYGVPVLLTVLYAVYYFVGVFGAQTLVGLLEENIFANIVNPFFTGLFNYVPIQFIRDIFVGEFGIITMAVTYALALILPIVTTFFLAFGALEDSGYLPRLACMVDRIFKKIGLNGRAVLPMILGLGCDTMAVLTARILSTKKEKILVTFLLALAIPCSAQLGVTLGILGAISFSAVLIWLGVILFVLFFIGYLSSKVIPGRSSDFILEIPPLRMPVLKNVVVKTLMRLEWYLKEAVPLFILGTLILFGLDKMGILVIIEKAFAPIVSGILGLPEKSAEAFILGFLRRDYGAAGFKGLFDDGLLDPIGAIVSLTTITLFVPCIANFFIIIKERGFKTAIGMIAFIIPFAILIGGLLNLVLRMVW